MQDIRDWRSEAFLDYMIANRLPAKTGRIRLCHSLNRNGGIHSEFTVTREADDSFYLVSAAAWQRLDHDYLAQVHARLTVRWTMNT